MLQQNAFAATIKKCMTLKNKISQFLPPQHVAPLVGK